MRSMASRESPPLPLMNRDSWPLSTRSPGTPGGSGSCPPRGSLAGSVPRVSRPWIHRNCWLCQRQPRRFNHKDFRAPFFRAGLARMVRHVELDPIPHREGAVIDRIGVSSRRQPRHDTGRWSPAAGDGPRRPSRGCRLGGRSASVNIRRIEVEERLRAAEFSDDVHDVLASKIHASQPTGDLGNSSLMVSHAFRSPGRPPRRRSDQAKSRPSPPRLNRFLTRKRTAASTAVSPGLAWRDASKVAASYARSPILSVNSAVRSRSTR